MFECDDRVRIVNCAELTGITGILLGTAIEYPISFWIVLLDKPLPKRKAIMVIESCLMKLIPCK